MVPTPSAPTAPGDGRAFGDLVAPYRRELHLYCYRMLGSLTDADDVLQDVLLAAWRGLDGFAGRSSLRTWLYSIATRRCLNAVRGRGRRARHELVPPFRPPEPSRRGDVPWLQPYPDAELARDDGPAELHERRETVSLAALAALQRLPPRQTAALVLCDVLGFPVADAAGMLDVTPTAAKGLLQRARAASAPAVTGGAGSATELRWAARFAEAYTRDDVDGLVALLTDDAWLAMPPAPHEYVGRDAVAGFLRASRDGRAGRRFLLVPTRANGQPAWGCFLDRPGAAPTPVGIVVVTVDDSGIRGVTRFLDPALVDRFGVAGPR
ncbi:RNA polymerase subunit sigma-70 [Nakamurella endophytica]|uniref:RNA polymerase subunit sigma-70 n=1 Tax=Nakamurella endophytica TaxID=1748367 RepID=UPI001E46BFF2|nr:RNA polymerase subunit sigma-70 [Nakamurella endophytica]